MTKKILIGKISSVFGVRGDIKIVSYCENMEDIASYPTFDEKGNKLAIKVRSVNNKFVIANVNGCKTRDEAEAQKDTKIYTNRENLPNTDDDEFYHIDLIGLNVVDLESNLVGKVLGVYDHGAGPLIEIEFVKPNLVVSQDKIELLSFTNQVFPEVNLDAGFIRIDFPEIVKI